MRKRFSFSFVSFISFFLAAVLSAALILPGAAQETTHLRKISRTIRIGFPIQEGFSQIDEKGNFSGYTYDYLMEIAQYTGWNYEFIHVEGNIDQQLTTLLAMLKNGEIDVMGAMRYHESLSSQYDYSGYSYGTSFKALYVLDDNDKIYASNLSAIGKIRVAVVSSSDTRNEELDEFAHMSSFEVEQVFCTNGEDANELLVSREVDALLSSDVNPDKNIMHGVAYFDPEPYYFATTIGNHEVVQGLNSALADITAANPYFSTTLYQKYFKPSNDVTTLTKEEQQFVDNSTPLHVVVLGGQAPIQYQNPSTGQISGISRKVLDYISEQTGLRFEYRFTESYSELETILQQGEADLIVGVNQNYKTARDLGYSFTIPYLDSPMIVAHNSSIKPSELNGKCLVIPKGLAIPNSMENDVLVLDTMRDCLEAVHHGDADFTYGNSYSIQYYMESNAYQNITLIPQPQSSSQKICFGVVSPADIRLLSIFNKFIRSIPEGEMQSYLYQNAYQPEPVTLLSYIQSNPLQAWGSLAVLCMALLIIFLVWYSITRHRSNRQMKLQNDRYNQLSALSNEFLFEYDIAEDKLVLPAKSAEFFCCNPILENFSLKYKDSLAMHKAGVFTFAEPILSQTDGSWEKNCVFPDDSRRWLRLISKIIYSQEGKPVYVIGKFTDIQNEKTEHELLVKQAQLDGMTEIYNATAARRLISSHLSNQKSRETGAFFILDIDYFKQINDQYGHYRGDQILIQVSRILRSIFRRDDIVGRIGGDEFVVYVSHTLSRETMEKKCNTLLQAVREITVNSNQAPITLSIGVVPTASGWNYNTAYQQADKALYEVKRRGRNGYHILDFPGQEPKAD